MILFESCGTSFFNFKLGITKFKITSETNFSLSLSFVPDHFFPRGGGVTWKEGFAYMSGSGTQVQINTCLADPCTGDNKIQTFIQGN